MYYDKQYKPRTPGALLMTTKAEMPIPFTLSVDPCK